MTRAEPGSLPRGRRSPALPLDVLRNERGGVLGCLFRLLLLGAVVFVMYKFGMPYFQAWRFKEAMAGQASVADVNPDPEIRAFLEETAANMDLPVSARDVKIRRSRTEITISADWQREVVLPKFSRTLHFHREVSAPLTPQKQ